VTGRRKRRRESRQLLDVLDQAIAPQRRTRLPALIWNWRYEFALVAGLALIATVLASTLGITWLIVGASAAVGGLSPPWSQRLTALAWHLVTPHLLRSGLAQARIHNRRGRQPFIVRVTGQPFGQRVRLWCPAGTSAEDISASRATLRAACWAADIRVRRDEQHSQMVTVDIIRRRDRA
jgi:hypothetical protein